jgi:hypothetical protein
MEMTLVQTRPGWPGYVLITKSSTNVNHHDTSDVLFGCRRSQPAVASASEQSRWRHASCMSGPAAEARKKEK